MTQLHFIILAVLAVVIIGLQVVLLLRARGTDLAAQLAPQIKAIAE